jgi:hypothetical protein
VIEEIDSKKYSNSKPQRDRARALLPRLEALAADDGSARQIQPGVTIEIPVEPGPRFRPQDADEEILLLCADVPQLIGIGQGHLVRTPERRLKVHVRSCMDRRLRAR